MSCLPSILGFRLPPFACACLISIFASTCPTHCLDILPHQHSLPSSFVIPSRPTLNVQRSLMQAVFTCTENCFLCSFFFFTLLLGVAYLSERNTVPTLRVFKLNTFIQLSVSSSPSTLGSPSLFALPLTKCPLLVSQPSLPFSRYVW